MFDIHLSSFVPYVNHRHFSTINVSRYYIRLGKKIKISNGDIGKFGSTHSYIIPFTSFIGVFTGLFCNGALYTDIKCTSMYVYACVCLLGSSNSASIETSVVKFAAYRMHHQMMLYNIFLCLEKIFWHLKTAE